MKKDSAAIVETQMLIRRPVEVVFEAFIDPAITTNFWFTKSSGRLEGGTMLTWAWEMYGISVPVYVREIVQNQKIVTEWGDPPTVVEYTFTPLHGDTYVVIQQYGFAQEGDDLIRVIRDSTGGFTTVLDGLKAYLEHNIRLNLVYDKYPRELVKHS